MSSSNFLESQLNQPLKNRQNHIPVKEIIIAIGLLFFIEGLFLAIFPSRIKSMLEIIKSTSENKLRIYGVVFLILGFCIIWYIKI